jgi:hypothetical protein
MAAGGTKEYYRQKRITRLENLYQRNPRGFRQDRLDEDVQTISRETLLRVLVTIVFMAIFMAISRFLFNPIFRRIPETANVFIRSLSFLPIVISSFIAVELADIILTKSYRVLDFILERILGFSIISLILLWFVGKELLTVQGSLPGSLKKFKDDMNVKIQNRPVAVSMTPESGKNWLFSTANPGSLETLSKENAVSFCEGKGPGWKVYDGDAAFIADPSVTMSRPFFVWIRSQNSLAVSQLNRSGIAPSGINGGIQ